MIIHDRPLLIVFFIFATTWCVGQTIDPTEIDETTYLGKVKFPTIFVAGQQRNNIKACNGEECGVSLSHLQKLNYRKAKIPTIGSCEIEMIIESDLLKTYQVVTKKAKETGRLIQEITKIFGTQAMPAETMTWTTMNVNGQTITSQLTISANKETGNFSSRMN
jgi:hypothetical protein